MKRYAAKLLFQFRVEVDGQSGKRRTCEEHIVIVEARPAASALTKSKRTGHVAEHDYLNSDGNTLFFAFVGVMEFLAFGTESNSDEVWYDIREQDLAMERRNVLISVDAELDAIYNKM
jgi:hypothetical protein